MGRVQVQGREVSAAPPARRPREGARTAVASRSCTLRTGLCPRRAVPAPAWSHRVVSVPNRRIVPLVRDAQCEGKFLFLHDVASALSLGPHQPQFGACPRCAENDGIAPPLNGVRFAAGTWRAGPIPGERGGQAVGGRMPY